MPGTYEPQDPGYRRGPRDLDWSDVEADAERMRAEQSEREADRPHEYEAEGREDPIPGTPCAICGLAYGAGIHRPGGRYPR